jgi:hypothetical protein
MCSIRRLVALVVLVAALGATAIALSASASAVKGAIAQLVVATASAARMVTAAPAAAAEAPTRLIGLDVQLGDGTSTRLTLAPGQSVDEAVAAFVGVYAVDAGGAERLRTALVARVLAGLGYLPEGRPAAAAAEAQTKTATAATAPAPADGDAPAGAGPAAAVELVASVPVFVDGAAARDMTQYVSETAEEAARRFAASVNVAGEAGITTILDAYEADDYLRTFAQRLRAAAGAVDVRPAAARAGVAVLVTVNVTVAPPVGETQSPARKYAVRWLQGETAAEAAAGAVARLALPAIAPDGRSVTALLEGLLTARRAEEEAALVKAAAAAAAATATATAGPPSLPGFDTSAGLTPSEGIVVSVVVDETTYRLGVRWDEDAVALGVFFTRQLGLGSAVNADDVAAAVTATINRRRMGEPGDAAQAWRDRTLVATTAAAAEGAAPAADDTSGAGAAVQVAAEAVAGIEVVAP